MDKNSWYEIADEKEPPIQGDFIDSCPIVIPSSTSQLGKTKAEILKYDVIIMSQSCDIKERKLDFVLLCPYWTLDEWGEKYPHFKDDNLKENLKRGYLFGHCLLNECSLKEYKGKKDYFVVDFRSVYSIPINDLDKIIKNNGKRLRLLNPYREYLSQAFARFFMRVGLPVDIPSFIK